jgi:hypothetical protein
MDQGRSAADLMVGSQHLGALREAEREWSEASITTCYSTLPSAKSVTCVFEAIFCPQKVVNSKVKQRLRDHCSWPPLLR